MTNSPPPLTPQPSSPNSPTPTYYQPAPKGGGGKKLFLGCTLGCFFLVLACIVGGFFLYSGVKKYAAKAAEVYVSSEPIVIEAPKATQAEIDSAVQKLDRFEMKVQEGSAPAGLQLTGEEINLIIHNTPGLSEIADKVSVTIEDDHLRSQISLNFDDLKLPMGRMTEMFRGKYLNGEVSLSTGMVAGRPALHIEELTLNGVTVPDAFISALKATNLLEEIPKNADVANFLDQIEDVRIQNGQLFILPKANP